MLPSVSRRASDASSIASASLVELPPSPVPDDARAQVAAIPDESGAPASAAAAPSRSVWPRRLAPPSRLPGLAVLGCGAAVGAATVASALALPAHPTKLLLGGGAGATCLSRLVHVFGDATGASILRGSWWQTAGVAGAFACTGAATAGAIRLLLRLNPLQVATSALTAVGLGLAPALLVAPTSPVEHEGTADLLGRCVHHAAAWEARLRLPLALASFLSVAVWPASGLVALGAAGLGVTHTALQVASHAGHLARLQDADVSRALHLQLPLASAAFVGVFVGHRLPRVW